MVNIYQPFHLFYTQTSMSVELSISIKKKGLMVTYLMESELCSSSCFPAIQKCSHGHTTVHFLSGLKEHKGGLVL